MNVLSAESIATAHIPVAKNARLKAFLVVDLVCHGDFEIVFQ